VTHTVTTPDSVGRMPATRNYEEPVRRYQAPQQAVSPPYISVWNRWNPHVSGRIDPLADSDPG